jgi:DNA-binding beta-propeller fold protein YncE
MFAGVIGGPGSGAGQMNQPAGVAVSEATGDVYVVDAGNNRVDRFGPSGQFLEAWGWGVADGAKEYEHCSSECRAGLPGHGKFQLDRANGIAVDNSGSTQDPSAGDVYVEANTTEEHETIEKFSPEGTPLGSLRSDHGEEFEELHGLTVAPNGALWVYNEEELFVFDDSEENRPCPAAGKKYSAPCPGFGEVEPEVEGEPGYGVAIDGKGGYYAGAYGLGGGSNAPATVAKLALAPLEEGGEPDLEVLIDELDQLNTTAVAADPGTGDVYLDNGSSIAAFDAEGDLIQHFGEEQGSRLSEAEGIGLVSATTSTDAAHAGYVYVAERSAGQVDVFVPEPPRRPDVDDLSSQAVTAEGGQLDAELDPGGSTAKYHFEYGLTPCSGKPDSCVDAPALPGGEIAAGCPRAEESACFFDESLSVQLAGLAPETTYHYRLVAANAQGVTSSGEHLFTTGPPEGHYLADARGWEMVSPADLNGGEAQPLSYDFGLIQASLDGTALAWVSSAPIGGAEGSRSLEATQLLSTRGATGWGTQDIVTPNERGTGLELGRQEFRMFSSSLALSLVQPFALGQGRLAEPPLSPPVSGEAAGQQEKTAYLRRDAPVAPAGSEQQDYQLAEANGVQMENPGFLALVNSGNVLAGTEFGKRINVIDATPDLSHVVIESEVPLTAGSAAGHNLYEWGGGTLRLINVLPGTANAPAASAQLGDANTMVRDAISDDGNRVFWSTPSNALYMRDLSKEETIEIDSGSGENDATFQGASADGSTVFFTDGERLTPNAGASHGKPDLYACEIREEEVHLGCQLTDLTPANPVEGADVLGVMMGASEDGSSVYFVANGALSEQSVAGQCRPFPQPGASCNLFLVQREGEAGHERWESPRLVARLANQDDGDWEPRRSGKNVDLGEVTSRVSPNGRYLAFMSQQSLTGYDNRDISPAAHGARDEEAFLYDSASGTLVCASCDPSGARPSGVFDPPDSNSANEEGWGLVVDQPKIWQDSWLAGSLPGWTKSLNDRALYQSRYLSDSGRLYFDSPADLVPEARNGKEDVYEYEPTGVPSGANQCNGARRTYFASLHGCLGLISSGSSPREATFLDASQSGGEASTTQEAEEGGGDVFFLSAGLSASARGASFSVYDAHECTSSRPCPQSEEKVATAPCASTEACRPLTYLPPVSTAPATSGSPQPSGAVLPSKTHVAPKSLTRAQRLTKALKACRKLKRQKKRLACEKTARKQFGPLKKKSSAKTKGAHR